MKIDIGINIDLPKLIESRLLIQANSGGGKSYAIRKLLEETNGKVQQLVLDLEGEFFSLREKYDFVVFGSEGDYPVHIKYADKIARTLLELNVSAIIDLYELKHHERITFVKRFLDSMVNAPKELWHSCLVVVDEAHVFCPEKGSADSASSVIDLCTRGRKRGYCAVLATQRLSKLHKDAAAECNNKLIGRTGLDVDMKRAGDELGFTTKQDNLSLRELGEGNFYAFGPALTTTITKIKISEVKTTHPKTGSRLLSIPPASDKIKKILAEFKDLPQEAEKELQTLTDFKKEIHSLKIQLGQAKRQQSVKEIIKPDLKIIEENKKLRELIKESGRAFARLDNIIIKVRGLVNDNKIELPKFNETKEAKIFNEALNKTEGRLKIEVPIYKPMYKANNYQSNISYETQEIKLREGARRMLAALVQWSPNGMTEGQMRSMAGLKNSGTYSAYKTDLRKYGFLEIKTNGLFYATDSAIEWLGHDIPSPQTTEEVLQVWSPKLRLGARRMLDVLISHNGEPITDEQLQEEAELKNSGTYSAYKTELRTAQLAIIQRGTIAANKETLFL